MSCGPWRRATGSFLVWSCIRLRRSTSLLFVCLLSFLLCFLAQFVQLCFFVWAAVVANLLPPLSVEEGCQMGVRGRRRFTTMIALLWGTTHTQQVGSILTGATRRSWSCFAVLGGFALVLGVTASAGRVWIDIIWTARFSGRRPPPWCEGSLGGGGGGLCLALLFLVFWGQGAATRLLAIERASQKKASKFVCEATICFPPCIFFCRCSCPFRCLDLTTHCYSNCFRAKEGFVLFCCCSTCSMGWQRSIEWNWMSIVLDAG